MCNPVRGFLSLRREVVVTLCDVGRLRWGAGDFGAESGDMMHFDQGTHDIFVPRTRSSIERQTVMAVSVELRPRG